MPDREEQFLAHVRKHTPEDAGVRSCWHLIAQAVRAGWLYRAELERIIDHLTRVEDYGIQAIFFDTIDGRIRVSFLGDWGECSREALLSELRTLSEHPALD